MILILKRKSEYSFSISRENPVYHVGRKIKKKNPEICCTTCEHFICHKRNPYSSRSALFLPRLNRKRTIDDHPQFEGASGSNEKKRGHSIRMHGTSSRCRDKERHSRYYTPFLILHHPLPLS
ncbi:hypothetical protein CEXT_256561 [Caerostris extrusa]|uniref:Uncharacterized protein n=1 Tax=Caerostris extrusa TaxID=172846 RepID=A0AAV4R7D9_CAEEX|nr:hypothetical protein CEXT_256561 [Caerostris extrusa]